MTIGIIGCCPGAGVTHLAISLSNYCRSKLREKTACVELSPGNELIGLASDEPEDDYFSRQGVDYYPALKSEEVPAILNRGYTFLILDCGSLQAAPVPEFLRCDGKLVLGSLAPWKTESYEHFLLKFQQECVIREMFRYFVRTENQKYISDFSKKHHIVIRSIPVIENPFRIDRELFAFFQELVS